jgi:hypothetical protein
VNESVQGLACTGLIVGQQRAKAQAKLASSVKIHWRIMAVPV